MTDSGLSSTTINEQMGNLQRVQAAITVAAHESGRDRTAVTLVAVTKTQEADCIRPFLAAGHRVFGENRVQEAQAKWPPLQHDHPGLRLHLIGPLQTNKVRAAVALFDVIETVDRPGLAATLAKEMERQSRWPDCLVQVNTGEEPRKAGVSPGEADTFIQACLHDWKLPVKGLMCIPPPDDEPAFHFALLRDIAHRHGLPVLSMGMSCDFPLAIHFGATHVRVGTALFGQR
ncbi:MAG: putative enzyme with PLP-binding domain alanine racemase [Rhodospirillaceae bacterium]|nr:MAG: putative enzyme with PLP-binding domain alanine racemase [Rhodospirillaceae bacterium]